MTNKLLERITLGGIFLVPIVPLIITDFLFFPYISGKNFLFRIIVEIIFAAWLLWAIKDPTVRPKKSSLLIVSILFVAFMALSAALGEVPDKSFWSNFERMEGVVGYLHVFLFMFVIACSMTKERFRTFFHINLGVATAISLYGIMQHLGVFLISQDGIRVDGTLGNPIYMAVYMLLCFFIVLYYFFDDREDNYRPLKYAILSAVNVVILYLLTVMGKVADGNMGKLFSIIALCVVVDLVFIVFNKRLLENKTRTLKIAYTLLGLLFVYLLYLTQTRGAILGLIAGLVVLAIILGVLDKGKSRKIALSSLGVLVVLCGLFFAVRNTAFIQNDPTLGRLARISLSDTTTVSRITIWGMAFEGFKEHPILGWGNENFNLVFNKYYQPKLITSEQWFDRSHNILLDWLVDTGLVGFLLYLSLYGTSLYYLYKRNSKFSVKEKAVITSLFVAYIVQNLFVFDNISGIMIFVSILGYIYVRNFEGEEVTHKNLSPQIVYTVSALAIILLVVSMYYANIKPLRAAYILNEGTLLSSKGKHAEALDTYKKVIALNTFATREAREHLMLASQRALSDPSTSNEVNQAFLQESVKQMQNQIKEFPGDARNYVLMGSYLKTYRLNDQAILFLEEAKKLSPKKQAIYQILADIYLTTGQTEKAIKEAKTAYDFYPESVESAKILTLVYIISGDQKSADAFLDKQFGSVYVYDPRFVSVYTSQKNYQRLEGIWKKYIEDNPNDLTGYMSLYALYTSLGKKEEAKPLLATAIAIREAMVAEDPNNIDKIIPLSDLYIQNGDIAKAKLAIEKATSLTEDYIKKHGDDYRAHLSLASFYMILGRKEDAISILQKALKIPGSPQAEINNYISTIASGGNPWGK